MGVVSPTGNYLHDLSFSCQTVFVYFVSIRLAYDPSMSCIISLMIYLVLVSLHPSIYLSVYISTFILSDRSI